jgi:hypothetical protein
LIASELQSRIIQATKQTEESYQLAVAELRELKAKINDLELVIVYNANSGVSGDKQKLDFAIDKLIKFTDCMIAKSERAWDRYKALEHNCRRGTSEPSDVKAQMKALRELCKKTDEFATDLLCYSLAHFKQKDAQKN